MPVTAVELLPRQHRQTDMVFSSSRLSNVNQNDDDDDGTCGDSSLGNFPLFQQVCPGGDLDKLQLPHRRPQGALQGHLGRLPAGIRFRCSSPA